jgi:hypothetical protein
MPFDANTELQEQFVMAGLVAAGGFAINTPPGEDIGGIFDDIPLCSALDQAGCVVV